MQGGGAAGLGSSPGNNRALTEAGVGPALAEVGRLHQEHAGLVRHPGAEDEQHSSQQDPTLREETGTGWGISPHHPHLPPAAFSPLSQTSVLSPLQLRVPLPAAQGHVGHAPASHSSQSEHWGSELGAATTPPPSTGKTPEVPPLQQKIIDRRNFFSRETTGGFSFLADFPLQPGEPQNLDPAWCGGAPSLEPGSCRGHPGLRTERHPRAARGDTGRTPASPGDTRPSRARLTCRKQNGTVSTLTPTMLFTTFMIRPQLEPAAAMAPAVSAAAPGASRPA